MIFNPLMKGEPILEARESKDSKGTHVMVQNFYSWGSRLQHTARGDVMFWE